MEIISKVFPKNYLKKDIIYILRKNYPKALIVEDPMTVQIEGLRFEFDKSGKLININPRARYEVYENQK